MEPAAAAAAEAAAPEPLIPQAPEVVVLQASAIVDHVCSVEEALLASLVQDEIGGSRRASLAELSHLLAQVGEFHSVPGGSASNTAKGLAAGFGVRVQLLGARGGDEWGAMFSSSLSRAQVDTSRMEVQPGHTGRSVILTCNGQRTMRTCLDPAVYQRAEELRHEHFAGAQWAYLSSYSLYKEGLLDTAVRVARSAGCRIALDLASWEIVRAFREKLQSLLPLLDVVVCNEDEAAHIAGEEKTSPEAGLEFLAGRCPCAVVTLGARGCMVARAGEEGVTFEPALTGIRVVDTTGAGDMFSAGFLYGLMRGFPTQRCAQIGCTAGAAAVRTLGAQLGPSDWQWLYGRLHSGSAAAAAVRDSAAAVHQELLNCYALIERLGRGAVYYGSARLGHDSKHWAAAEALAFDASLLLGSTTWTGGGPGLMEAASAGADRAGCSVGGIRIAREAGTTVRSGGYLGASVQVVCRFLSARKVALTDAGVRKRLEDHTAYVFLPGGLGTMDELFELLTLVQLGKLGSPHKVPILLMNYDGYFDGLLHFLRTCDSAGTVGARELAECFVADTNEAALAFLADYYGLQRPAAAGGAKAKRASSLMALDSQEGELIKAAAALALNGASGTN